MKCFACSHEMCGGSGGTLGSVTASNTTAPSEKVTYPDIDLHLQPLPDGTRRFTRKDGTPY